MAPPRRRSSDAVLDEVSSSLRDMNQRLREMDQRRGDDRVALARLESSMSDLSDRIGRHAKLWDEVKEVQREQAEIRGSIKTIKSVSASISAFIGAAGAAVGTWLTKGAPPPIP